MKPRSPVTRSSTANTAVVRIGPGAAQPVAGGLPKPHIVDGPVALTAEQQALANKFSKVEADKYQQRQQKVAAAREQLVLADPGGASSRVLFS
jgi:hypothetical protein